MIVIYGTRYVERCFVQGLVEGLITRKNEIHESTEEVAFRS